MGVVTMSVAVGMVSAGAVANRLVIMSNDGMPVPVWPAVGGRTVSGAVPVPVVPGTSTARLADVIRVPWGMVSLGDCLMAAAILVFLTGALVFPRPLSGRFRSRTIFDMWKRQRAQ